MAPLPKPVRVSTDQPQAVPPKWIEDALKSGQALEPDAFDGFAELEIRRELIEGILPEYGIAFIAGKSSSGKTAVALDMAACMARGVDWAGKVVPERVGVAYFAYEGNQSVKARWKAICEAIGDEMRDVPFYPFLRPFPLNERHSWDDMLATLAQCRERSLAEHGVELGAVFIDTVAASLMVSDENSTDAWSLPLTTLHQLTDYLQIVALPIVHSGKDDSENPIRGSSNAYSAADRVLVVKVDKHEGKVNRRWLYLEKDKDGGGQGYLADVLMRSVDVGTKGSGAPLSAALVEYDLDGERRLAEEKVRAKAVLTGNETKVVRAIARMAHQSGEEKPRTMSDGRWLYVASMHLVESEARKYIDTKNFKRDFAAGVNGLLTRDWLEMDDRLMRYRLTSPEKISVSLLALERASSDEEMA